MKLHAVVIFIPTDEQEAITYLSFLTEEQPEFLDMLVRDGVSNHSAVSKIQHLVNIGACEEMSAAQNETFEQEIVRYELEYPQHR